MYLDRPTAPCIQADKKEREGCMRIEEEFDLPRPLAALLRKRGFTSTRQIRTFLYPDFSLLPQPLLMRGLEGGAAVIARACAAKKPIIIHGDYDVDGVTATALLVKFFHLLGLETFYHIPNRLTDQYGFTVHSVERIMERSGFRNCPLITVDCGITSLEATTFAREQGFEVIITDHHQPSPMLPQAEAVINPKQPHCDFPFKELSGVGVAFFFAAAVRRVLQEQGYWKTSKEVPNLKQFLDFVALGTIADVMPLTETNRILVKGGLEVLNQQRRLGIYCLAERCGMLHNDLIQAEDVSFKLAPRINAAGRMGEADHAVRLLLTENTQEAKKAAGQLDALNNRRRKLESQILEEILEQCALLKDRGAAAMTIYHPACHPGILGIVASRITDRFNCPAIVVTDEQADSDQTPLLKGSGRSIEGLNLYRKIESCKSLVKQFGGHPMAIGVTLPKNNLKAFRQAFNACCSNEPIVGAPRKLPVDHRLQTEEIASDDFLNKLQLFQPFGEGNPEPLFLLPKTQLVNVKELSGHLKCTLALNNGITVNGIGFYMAEKIPIVQQGPVDIIFKLKRSSYRGVQRREVQIVDIAVLEHKI